MTKISNYVRPGAAGIVFPSTPGSSSVVSSVTDGVTTVKPASEIDFTSGATVSDLGSGVAGVAISSLTDPTTTEGDLIYRHTGALARLPIGSNTYILTSNGTDPSWQAAGAGSSPLTTKGDLYTYSTTNDRLPVGSNGLFLKADSTQPTGLAWAAASGGSGALAAHPMPLDAYTIDGTYGDDFTGASLSGIWTRRNFTSGAETYQVGPETTYLRVVNTGRAAGDGYFQTAPAGDWTFAMALVPRYWTTVMAWSLVVVDTSGTGVGVVFYNSPAAFLIAGITTYTTYSGAFQQATSWGTTIHIGDDKLWMYLRKASGNYFGSYSLDGEVWAPETPALASAITVNRVGMMAHPLGGMVTTAVEDIDWFNKIA